MGPTSYIGIQASPLTYVIQEATKTGFVTLFCVQLDVKLNK